MSGPKKKSSVRHVQYAALPFRRRPRSRTQVMLVTSRETGRWIIPKGWPKKRKAPYTTAAREALEEAGVIGKVSRDPVGSYLYKKRLKSGAVVACEVHVFSLEVRRQRKQWPEKEEREFQWFSPADAAQAVQEPDLSDIIRTFPKRQRTNREDSAPQRLNSSSDGKITSSLSGATSAKLPTRRGTGRTRRA